MTTQNHSSAGSATQSHIRGKYLLAYLQCHCLTGFISVSVSNDPALRQQVKDMSDWLANQLKSLGVTTEQVDLGKQTLDDGSELDLPKAVLGRIGEDPKKKTVLVYGHFDVMPVRQSIL